MGINSTRRGGWLRHRREASLCQAVTTDGLNVLPDGTTVLLRLWGRTSPLFWILNIVFVFRPGLEHLLLEGLDTILAKRYL